MLIFLLVEMKDLLTLQNYSMQKHLWQWVANTGLDILVIQILNSEVHTTLELGFENMFMGSHVNGSIYINDISDYITTYRASDGTYDNTVNDARVYKNVDATIWGYELSIQKNLSSNVKGKINLNYTHGDDDTQNRPLPQIMPLAGDISLEYETALVNYGYPCKFCRHTRPF